MYKFKKTITEMKSAFDGLINRLDTGDRRTSELEDRLVKTS
jgi:hypothetical protein